MPRVSVVIPAYNATEFISETIDSALAQTYQDVEIIVVDDGSTDNTGDLMRAYGDKVRYIRQENAGVSVARNNAIAQAKGELVAFLDHDDLWLPTKLDKQVQLFNRDPDVALVYSDCFMMTSEGKLRGQYFGRFKPHRGHVFEDLLLANFIPCLTVLLRKDVLATVGCFQPGLAIAEEWDLFLRIAEYHAVDFINEPLGCYRLLQTGFSRNFERSTQEAIGVTETWLRKRPDLSLRLGGRLKHSVAGYRRALACHYISSARLQEARQQVIESLKLYPFQFRAFIFYGLTWLPQHLAGRVLGRMLTAYEESRAR